MQRMPCLSLAVCLCENWKSTRNVSSFSKTKWREATTTKHHSMKSTERTNEQCCFHNNLMICTQQKKRAHIERVREKRKEKKRNGTECWCTRHKHIDAEMKSHLKIFKEDIHRAFTAYWAVCFLAKRHRKTHTPFLSVMKNNEKSHSDSVEKKIYYQQHNGW